MYYRAQKAALNNGHDFHVVAILKRNKTVVKIGVNSAKTNPKFGRVFSNGCSNYHLHAEMNVLRFAKEGDEITVLRFIANGSLSMAKPCKFCHFFLKKHGFKSVKYSGWDGEIHSLKIT